MGGDVREKSVTFAEEQALLSDIEIKIITHDEIAKTEINDDQIDDGEIGEITER